MLVSVTYYLTRVFTLQKYHVKGVPVTFGEEAVSKILSVFSLSSVVFLDRQFGFS